MRDKAERFGKRGREYALKSLSKTAILGAFEQKLLSLKSRKSKQGAPETQSCGRG
ncbi:MAG: hypothetical protein Kow0099_29900 [Candidatus Abyssubacteria bacterium]